MALIHENQGKASNLFQNLTHIKAFFVDVMPIQEKHSNPIIFISIPKNQIRSFMQQGTPDTLITIHSNGLIGNNGLFDFVFFLRIKVLKVLFRLASV